MALDFAARVERVEPSATLAISNLASELEADGADVVDLSVGEPDFPTPRNIVDAGKAALDAGHTGYTPSNGIPELRRAISEDLAAAGLEYDPGNIVVTPGAKQALYETVQTLVDTGDEVVLIDPAWVSYEAMVKLAGGQLKRVDLSSQGFQLEPALPDLTETVSDATELLVVNSPCNPSGAVFSRTALEGVRDLAMEHDITAVSDEIYRAVSYGVDPPSLGALDGMDGRTVTINGFSKAYSMTGWRLGYLTGPTALVDQAAKLHSHSVSCATNFVQRAGVEALRNTEDAAEEMRRAFRDRRDLLVGLFEEQGIGVSKPDGAFYLMLPVGPDGARLPKEGAGGENIDRVWCEGALEDAHVATVPGSAFGTPGFARLSYAASEDRLREGVERLAEAGYL